MAHKRSEVPELEKMLQYGRKKFVRYDEGAKIYSMGLHSFMNLAKDAGATYRIKGIVLVFFGLNCVLRYEDDFAEGLEYAERGILCVVPYNDPWAWMNRRAVRYTDEIVAVLREKYGLGDDVRIVSTGGSMGGLSALVYCAYAAVTPVACVANCPVCDLVYHYTERPDLPRTLYSAFADYEGTMDEALRSASPLHLAQAGRMPDIPYVIFHCEQDKAVNLERHSRRFVEEMKKTRNVTLRTVPLRGHVDLSPAARVEYLAAIEGFLNG